MHNHKEKHLKASVRHLVKTDIHHPERIIHQSQIINHIAHKEMSQHSEKKQHQKLVDLVNEISILAESAIKVGSLAQMRVGQQLGEKLKALETLYNEMFCNARD